MVRGWFFEKALSHGPTVELAGIWTKVAKEFNGHTMLMKGDLTMTFSDDLMVWVVEKPGATEPIATACESADPWQKELSCKHVGHNVLSLGLPVLQTPQRLFMNVASGHLTMWKRFGLFVNLFHIG